MVDDFMVVLSADFLMKLLIILCVLPLLCVPHPQCLDYQPPFRADGVVNFCNENKDYGCCVASRDADIKYDFNYLMERLETNVSQQCSDIMKDLLCSECHPYAAHIYDAERLTFDKRFEKRNVNFPGLCFNTCMGIFDTCKEAIALFARTTEFSSFIRNSSANTFCEWAQIPDDNYCYPNIKTIGQKKYTPTDNSMNLCVEALPGVFRNPLFAITPKDNTHRMFVGEQQGVIYVLDKDHQKRQTPFLNITDRIINSGSPWDERGLLGMAFHPNYKINGRFFLYYSAADKNVNRSAHSTFEWYWRKRHNIRVSEFVVSAGDPNVADVDSELVLLEINQPEPNHNGGMLLFDKHGYLNVFVGDGGGHGDPHGDIGNGLNLTTLLGKVLRIDINNEYNLYSVPKDNPFMKFPNVRPEIYAYGIRNIWRCSLDNVDNSMLCGDVGQNKFEEINVIKKGRNYGWKAFEGHSCYDEDLCKQRHKNLEAPILVYNHSVGQSIVGGYVYRGCQNPNLYGKYFYADTMNGRIFVAERKKNENLQSWAHQDITMGNETICKYPLTNEYPPHILSFGESESNEIFILATGYPDPEFPTGRIFRLVDPFQRSDPTVCKINIKPTKAPEILRRRLIYYRLKNLPKPPPVCVDKRHKICLWLFGEEKGKKARYKCSRFKSYAKNYCENTCKYCK